MDKNPSVEVKNLKIGYHMKRGRIRVIQDSLSVSLFPGELTCLLGLNGTGKSTLLRTICGFQPAISGDISILGKNINDYSQHEFSLIVGVVLTEKTNAGGITVYELVSLGRHPHTGFWGRLDSTDRKVVEESIEAVGISHKADSFVAELSDGERQKAMIAKTLAQECPVIILDEPTAFLDVKSRIETMSLLRKLASEQNKSILLSTHDIDLAIRMSDRIWLLDKNIPMSCGTPSQIIKEGKFERSFGKGSIAFFALRMK